MRMNYFIILHFNKNKNTVDTNHTGSLIVFPMTSSRAQSFDVIKHPTTFKPKKFKFESDSKLLAKSCFIC